MEKLKEIILKIARPTVLLILIILLESIYTLYYFTNVKNGFHSDEMWSYGLSNSYYLPSVYLPVYDEDNSNINYINASDCINLNEWISGEYFNDYLTVQEGERFSYDSVYYNQTKDVHPPFYYFLLHTISSFFPNKFSFVYGLIINLISLAITQVFLYKLSKLLLRSKYAALIPCLLYGAGTGSLSTFVFVRMYSLATALLTMYTYYNAKLLSSEDFNLKKYIPPIFITSFLAFLTVYESIIYIGIFTLCFCIYLLVKKRIKKMFIYGGFELASLLLFIAVFPSFLTQLFMKGDSTEITLDTYWYWFRIMLNYITAYNLGIRISIYQSSTPTIIFAIVITICILAIPLCFLFRKEKWFISFKSKAKSFIKTNLLRFVNWLKSANYIPTFICISSLAVAMLMYFMADLSHMGSTRIRYITIVFPMVCSAAICLIRIIWGLIPKIKGFKSWLCLLTAILIAARVNIKTTTPFTFDSSNNFNYLSQDVFEDKNCLLVFPAYASYTVYTNMTYYLKDTANTYATYAEALEENIDDITSSNVDIVVISTENYTIDEDEQRQQLNEIIDNSALSEYESSQEQSANVVTDDDVDLDEIFDEANNFLDCTEVINSISSTDTWGVEAFIELNGTYYYILENK